MLRFHTSKGRESAGFTLIELLVVIGIIGVLASVVLASLNSARRRSRDARRISDVKQIQLALELRFDTANTYPTDAEGIGLLDDALSCGTGACMPATPADPLGGAYGYDQVSATNYLLRAVLEENTQSGPLGNDLDGDQGAFVGAGTNCNDPAYCVGP